MIIPGGATVTCPNRGTRQAISSARFEGFSRRVPRCEKADEVNATHPALTTARVG